ncbi:MAG: hypothetical protein GY796_30230, partial [Chloroflexi bacterium]|nr:hypothetical protein [Chloroflexota bacterium]
DNSLADWVTSGGLSAAIVNGNLRLGDSTSSCTNSPPGVATAVINLDMPTDSGYKLYIDAIMTTYDQLPDPSEDKFDAFEVSLDGSFVQRFGNPDSPLNCNTERTVIINPSFSLDTYVGSSATEVRFDNYRRFDNFYNTYTDINKIYIGK